MGPFCRFVTPDVGSEIDSAASGNIWCAGRAVMGPFCRFVTPDVERGAELGVSGDIWCTRATAFSYMGPVVQPSLPLTMFLVTSMLHVPRSSYFAL